MKTQWRKPQFHLSDLSILVALLAIVFAVLPAWCSPVVASMIVGMSILNACGMKFSQIIELAVLLAIGVMLFAVAMPALQMNCPTRKRFTPVAPVAPAPVDLPIPTP